MFYNKNILLNDFSTSDVVTWIHTFTSNLARCPQTLGVLIMDYFVLEAPCNLVAFIEFTTKKPLVVLPIRCP